MVFRDTKVVFRDLYLTEFCKEEPGCPSTCAAAIVAKRPAVPTPVDGRGSQAPKALTRLFGPTASRSPVAFMRCAGSGP